MKSHSCEFPSLSFLPTPPSGKDLRSAPFIPLFFSICSPQSQRLGFRQRILWVARKVQRAKGRGKPDICVRLMPPLRNVVFSCFGVQCYFIYFINFANFLGTMSILMKNNTTIIKKMGVAGTPQQPKPITAGPAVGTCYSYVYLRNCILWFGSCSNSRKIP